MTLDRPERETQDRMIVEILSNMDAEIRALEEKLVKAGMMSELLTGKIRLV
jgi:type I restriction enzyme S subunit